MPRINPTFEYLKARLAMEQAKRTVHKVITVFSGADLGTFVTQNVVTGAMARCFDPAYSLALFIGTPAWREMVVACNPYVSASMKTDPATGFTVPMDWFDQGVGAPVRCPDEVWYDRHFHEPHLVLLPSMMPDDLGCLAALDEAPVYFELAGGFRTQAETVLARIVPRSIWFATLCLDADGPDGRGACDPAAYGDAVRRIVGRGGRVLLVGADTGAALPATEGLADLRGPLDSHGAIHAAALARSRFFIGTGSGMTALAQAFGVPTAATNSLRAGTRVWTRDALVLTKTFVLADGRRLSGRDALAAGLLDQPPAEDVQVEDNAPEALGALADVLYRETRDITAWRPDPAHVRPAPTNRVTFPPRLLDQPLWRFADG